MTTSQPNTLRWGVIGAGGIARRRTIPEGILRSASSSLEAVYDCMPQLTGEVAEAFNATPCSSVEELLSLCNAVYVATPNDTHLAYVRQAAAAGVHVLCEKPLGLNVQQTAEAVACCQAGGVELGVGLMMPYHGGHQRIRHLLAAGTLGKPVLARAQLSCWYPFIPGAWRQDPQRGGGALADLASHCLHLLEELLGPIISVHCRAGRLVHDYPVEDSALISLEFANGAYGTIDAMFSIPDAAVPNRLEIYGTRGAVLAEGTIGQQPGGSIKVYHEAVTGGYNADQQRAGSAPAFVPLDYTAINPYEAEIEAFAQAVLTGRPAPVGGETASRLQALLAACRRSARDRIAVRV